MESRLEQKHPCLQHSTHTLYSTNWMKSKKKKKKNIAFSNKVKIICFYICFLITVICTDIR